MKLEELELVRKRPDLIVRPLVERLCEVAFCAEQLLSRVCESGLDSVEHLFALKVPQLWQLHAIFLSITPAEDFDDVFRQQRIGDPVELAGQTHRSFCEALNRFCYSLEYNLRYIAGETLPLLPTDFEAAIVPRMLTALATNVREDVGRQELARLCRSIATIDQEDFAIRAEGELIKLFHNRQPKGAAYYGNRIEVDGVRWPIPQQSFSDFIETCFQLGGVATYGRAIAS